MIIYHESQIICVQKAMCLNFQIITHLIKVNSFQTMVDLVLANIIFSNFNTTLYKRVYKSYKIM